MDKFGPIVNVWFLYTTGLFFPYPPTCLHKSKLKVDLHNRAEHLAFLTFHHFSVLSDWLL